MFKKIFLSVIIILVLLPVFPERGTAAERFEEAREKFLKTIEKKEDDNKNETIPSPLKIITDADKEEILEISAPNISYQISGKLLNIVWGKNYDATHYEISEKVVLPSGEESEIIHNNSNNFFTRPELDKFFGCELYYKVRALESGNASDWSNEIKVNLLDEFLNSGKFALEDILLGRVIVYADEIVANGEYFMALY